jgi:tetratricopeptide (TPR) repeat protein
VRERLELFGDVCRAVQHAHQKGIIHRDIKPSNVLVAPYDGKPVVKVIDFGVAKAAGQRLTDRTMFTGFGALVGTPEYMSPEQAEVNNQDIDTRSDIYSLGVLLYELLTGSPPFTRKGLETAGLLETLRAIREEEPTRPSAKLSTAEGLPTLAANRGTEPAKLTRLVRGELDWIVMKALEKDRNRRYETANGLALDVQRYLADEPVEACPPSAGYRLRKFARKNKKALATAGAFLALLAAAAGVSTWQAVRARQAEAATNASAERARQSAEEAERNAQQARDEANAKAAALAAEQQARADETRARRQAFDALRSMTTDLVERKLAQGPTLTDDDRAFLRCIIAQFDAFAAIKANDPGGRVMEAEGRFQVANMRLRLGELREAEKYYDQALSTLKQLVAEFPKRPELRGDLAQVHKNRAALLAATGRPQEAEGDYDQALGVLKQLAAEFPDRTDVRKALATCHNNRGVLLYDTGRLKEAEQDYDQALSIKKQLAVDFPNRPDFRHDLAQSLVNRGNLLKQTGRPPEAEQLYGQALSILEQLAADFPKRPEVRLTLAKCHNNLGNLLKEMGRLKEAEKEHDRALSLRKRLAADFPSRPEFGQELANSHNNRGALLCDAGRLQEAERDYDQALGIYKQLAADSPNQPDLQNELAMTFMNRAVLHKRQRNWAAAKGLLLEGRPHHLAALRANPRNPIYRRIYRNHLNVLIEVHAGLLEPEDAVRTAETCRDLGWNAPRDTYDAACYLSDCIPIAAGHDKLDDEHRKAAVQFYGDAAMRLLRDAVSKGWKDVAHMKKDTDLDPLRQREDFGKLIADLEGKGK